MVVYNVGSILEAGWGKVGAARCEKCGLERWIEDAEMVG